MTYNGIDSRQDAEAALMSACEGLSDCLRELQALHLDMDGPEGSAVESKGLLSLRLRKAYLHVQSVTSWEIGHHVLHVMAPDMRAAHEQLDPLVVPELFIGDKMKSSGARGGHTSERDRILKLFCHPTAVTLIYGAGEGGLGTDSTRELVRLVPLLGELVNAYGLALGMMGDALGHSLQSNIVSVIERAEGQLRSATPEALRPFIEHGDSEALRRSDH